MKKLENFGLYQKSFEHDSCGVGFVASVNGEESHQIVLDGIEVLKNLVHRGALGGDLMTGDGAGILVQIPHEFFVKVTSELGFNIGDKQTYGVGFLFLPKEKNLREKIEGKIEVIVKKEGGNILGWRDVPTRVDCLGDIARKEVPNMRQLFVSFPGFAQQELERKLYILRRRIEIEVSNRAFYIPSLSSLKIVYKGMFVASQFEGFYPDLNDINFSSPFTLVHQRYSTNTFPSWSLAHPFRYIAHNGEVNTLKGNVNHLNARLGTLSSEVFGEDIKKVLPVIIEDGSDSAIFDNVFELLVMAGRSIEHVMMMMIPEAFGNKFHISADKRAFYEYHSAFMEPWDGPAAIVFTDGIKIGAVLDRNGLRPLRYIITKNGKVVLASEMGVLDMPEEEILEKGRLAPGKMFLVDTNERRIKKDNEIKASISRQKPYRRWLEENRIELKGLLQPPGPVKVHSDSLVVRQKAFGYTFEDLNMIIIPMAENAQEPIGSMGDDQALAVLSDHPQLLQRYFKQLFAQVTNPPIDPYRENLVMSLMSFIGREQNLLEETPKHCHQLKLAHPILTNEDMIKLINFTEYNFKTCVVQAIFNTNNCINLEKAIEDLCINVEMKVDEGYSIVVISDKDIDKEHVPIPALLATSAVSSYLVEKGKRHLVGLIIQSGEVKEVMDYAVLIGYGASAVNPYLVFETIANLKEEKNLFKDKKLEVIIDNYITAVKKGLLKIMSKMGVSTIRSYKTAQLFEAVGLNEDFVNKYFKGTPSRIGGIGLDIIEKETLIRHGTAYNDNNPSQILESGGKYHYRVSSEKHLFVPEAIVALQKAVRSGDYFLYKEYSQLINNQNHHLCTLRSIFTFKNKKSIPLEEVENVEAIMKRFTTSAMSFGSISKEAHETMAIAMNRIGASSNSGEGGEDEERYNLLANGDNRTSMVKQVASARFGVTSHYLTNAREIQIKMAQGAKPGEGGQLPGHKVNKIIAKVRYSTPGVMLISPPPHHDIYSIEDLAQLIFDLKNANPKARISVKLVSEVGVGTIAAGVAKGKADTILISGGDGGTGASPLSSIKHVGIPWEIGLAETQQTLILNNLRNRVRLQVDGQLRTGRDVVIGALLGAEEFGFGTVSLVTLGCVLMRKCHMNTCLMGIATQDEILRRNFKGQPDHLINFMRFIAQEVREIMAEMGFRNFNEMVGQQDRIEFNKEIKHWKAKNLDLTKIFMKPRVKKGEVYFCNGNQENNFTSFIDNELIKQAVDVLEERKENIKLFTPIKNNNRSVGAKLSYEVSKRFASKGLKDNSIYCRFKGVAGESFAAFLAHGITFELEGDANNFLGKGLSGGRIILYPPKDFISNSHNNIITGNVNLFGATSGEVFIGGMAGERFAVRNSGATAVVEGLGDHGCEYMTGGCVIILGSTGVNFAAGMSGGIAYVLDIDQLFDTRCNLEMVELESLASQRDIKFVYQMIKKHIVYTDSPYAKMIIDNWVEMLPKFVKVYPIDYRKAIERIREEEKAKESEVLTITEEVY